jgi:hypothetical protein
MLGRVNDVDRRPETARPLARVKAMMPIRPIGAIRPIRFRIFISSFPSDYELETLPYLLLKELWINEPYS